MLKNFDINASVDTWVTQKGRKVVDFHLFDAEQNYPLYVQLDNGAVYPYTLDGKYFIGEDDPLDLFVEVPDVTREYYLNIYPKTVGGGHDTIQSAHDCAADDQLGVVKVVINLTTQDFTVERVNAEQ